MDPVTLIDNDWPKIRQVVAEVHDIGGRVVTMTELLESHGFDHVVVEQEAGYRNSNIPPIVVLMIG